LPEVRRTGRGLPSLISASVSCTTSDLSCGDCRRDVIELVLNVAEASLSTFAFRYRPTISSAATPNMQSDEAPTVSINIQSNQVSTPDSVLSMNNSTPS